MGKWKYVNWFVVIIILAHMYYYFAHRYEAHLLVYVLSTAGWLSMAVAGYYIFVFKIASSGGDGKEPAGGGALPKQPVRERPKVSFRKKEG